MLLCNERQKNSLKGHISIQHSWTTIYHGVCCYKNDIFITTISL